MYINIHVNYHSPSGFSAPIFCIFLIVNQNLFCTNLKIQYFGSDAESNLQNN